MWFHTFFRVEVEEKEGLSVWHCKSGMQSFSDLPPCWNEAGSGRSWRGRSLGPSNKSWWTFLPTSPPRHTWWIPILNTSTLWHSQGTSRNLRFELLKWSIHLWKKWLWTECLFLASVGGVVGSETILSSPSELHQDSKHCSPRRKWENGWGMT